MEIVPINKINNRNNRSLISFDEIIKHYLNLKPTTKIARIAGISPTRVHKILVERNVPMRTKEESERLKRKYDYDAIVADYKNGMFLIDVAKKYKTGSSCILKIIKNGGIKSRGSEGIKKGKYHHWWKGGKTNDKDGYI